MEIGIIEETLTRECEECGTIFELGDDRETLCDECREHYYICDRCGERVHEDNLCTSNNYENFCEDCYNDVYTTCEHCGHEIRRRESTYAHGDYYCHGCFSDLFTYCHRCDEIIHIDDANFNEDDDEYYCDACYERVANSSHIHGYHNFNERLRFYNHNDTDTDESTEYLYLGAELEVDNIDDKVSTGSQIYGISQKETLFHMESDSSLDEGFEIVTMPCTLDYHRDQFPWKDITGTVRENGGKSNDVNTCGLHIHFNRSYLGGNEKIATLKLLYLFEKFWDQLVIFSRRRSASIEEYAMRYYDQFLPCDDPESKLYETRSRGRYFAVNLRNSRTIEIRLFKGTLKTSTILASLEMVDYLVNLCKDTGIIKLQRLTWIDITAKIDPKKYPNLINYLADRNLIENKQLTLAENNEEEN